MCTKWAAAAAKLRSIACTGVAARECHARSHSVEGRLPNSLKQNTDKAKQRSPEEPPGRGGAHGSKYCRGYLHRCIPPLAYWH